ncbi:HISTONE-LYSINE N-METHYLTRANSFERASE SETD1B-LIKE PROTEIN [Salix purpurea]|uniref:HISTONE-LYSINE N-METHYLTRANSFERASE SETD1B-LIKE PROTEIN n=1 Tax=Salix purpurea TaxID=77065 RepID=A0A9Q0Q3B9_SALPP|nr:HISTONE-LYSINE N-METHYLTRANSFERASE SETD1B-LIKE PROTEIN [Salix purpurea]
MAQKQLQELLQDDQEPFQLKSYIADRRCQLQRLGIPKTNLVQVKKRKPISQKRFCKNVCLFSFQNSPDPRKSPLFQRSPPKSPCKSPNAIFLHIPARTAALLLEAAVRVQKQSSSPKTKSQKNGEGDSEVEFLSWAWKFIQPERSPAQQGQEIIMVDASIDEKCGCETGFNSCCSSHIDRPSSEVWSEKSLDLDFDTSSSTSQSEDQNIDHFVNEDIIDHGDFSSNDKQYFCDSPFHFALQRSPSTGCRTPDFSSPVTSPSRHIFEGKENNGDEESLEKLKEQNDEERKKKIRNSVVLYAFVQRAKKQLLQKLRRFERLADLDPVELERRMAEQEDDEEEEASDLEEEEHRREDDELISSDSEKNIETFILEEIHSKSSFHLPRKIQIDMKRLISDLIVEEGGENVFYRESMGKRICKRLESWTEVESNTIDMMVGQDFRRELDGWRGSREQVEETALEIELGIVGLLVEELSEELIA